MKAENLVNPVKAPSETAERVLTPEEIRQKDAPKSLWQRLKERFT